MKNPPIILNPFTKNWTPPVWSNELMICVKKIVHQRQEYSNETFYLNNLNKGFLWEEPKCSFFVKTSFESPVCPNRALWWSPFDDIQICSKHYDKYADREYVEWVKEIWAMIRYEVNFEYFTKIFDINP